MQTPEDKPSPIVSPAGSAPDETISTKTGKAATQERILAAATKLFIARGYTGTTVTDIATEAGVSRATVFWHFSDKGGLFREAFSRVLEPYRQSLERDLSDIEPGKRLAEHIADGERFAQEHSAEIAAFVGWAMESPEFREPIVKTLMDLNRRFGGVLAQTLSELLDDEQEAHLLAQSMMLAFDASLLLQIFDASSQAAEERSAAVSTLARFIADKAHV